VDAALYALVTFACSITGGAIGFLIRRRTRDIHVPSPVQEILKLSVGVVATLAALVLGLLVGGTKQFYDGKVNELRTFVVNITLLDRAMAHYEPSLIDERRLVRKFTKGMLVGLWGLEEPIDSHPDLLAKLDQVRDKVRHMQPATDELRLVHARILALTETLMLSGAKLIETDDAAIPLALFGVVDAWLVVIFLLLGLFAPPNRISVPAVGLSAAAVSMAVFLVVEMSTPFEGLIMISPTIMQQALDQITEEQQRGGRPA
jgi:hypothetical protein